MNTKTKGLYLILATGVISGFAVFFNKFAVGAFESSSVYTTMKNLIVALILSLAILTPAVANKLSELKKKDWLKLILIGLVGGSIPFLLFFKGLSMTTAVSAGFLHKTLFIWVTLLAIPFLKEKVSKIQLGALLLLVFGNVFFLGGVKVFNFDAGSLLIIASVLLWSVEYIIVKKLISHIQPKVLAWSRMAIGSVFLMLFLVFTGQFTSLFSVSWTGFAWTMVAGVFLLGYVITWYSSMKYLPVTVVASVLVIGSPITTMLNNVFVTHSFKVNQIIGGLIILASAGVILFIHFRKNNAVIEQQKI
jgi:drug/metabolite transporter (DMT)-like permease